MSIDTAFDPLSLFQLLIGVVAFESRWTAENAVVAPESRWTAKNAVVALESRWTAENLLNSGDVSFTTKATSIFAALFAAETCTFGVGIALWFGKLANHFFAVTANSPAFISAFRSR
jgi:hypothetical protein